MRTHKEEQRKREAEQRALDLLSRKQTKEEDARREKQEQQDAELLAQLAEAVNSDEEDDENSSAGEKTPPFDCMDLDEEMEQAMALDLDDLGWGPPNRHSFVSLSEIQCMIQDGEPLDGTELDQGLVDWGQYEFQPGHPLHGKHPLRSTHQSARREGKAGEIPLRKGRESQQANKAEVFDMEADLEEELLGMGEAQAGSTILPGRDSRATEQKPRDCVASQETDYGDLDVTVEDLDDYF